MDYHGEKLHVWKYYSGEYVAVYNGLATYHKTKRAAIAYLRKEIKALEKAIVKFKQK